MNEIKKVVLPNGIKIYYTCSPIYTISTCALRIGSGAYMENKGENSGWSHYLEHMIFKSSEKYSTSKRNEFFAENAVTINAYTDLEDIFFYYSSPNRIFEKTFDVFLDMLFNPLFLKEEMEIEKKVVFSEAKQRSIRASSKCFKLTQDYGYSKESKNTFFTNRVLGRVPDIKKCNQSALRDFYEKNFDPRNITIAIAASPRDFDKFIKKVETLKLKPHPYNIVSKVKDKINIARHFKHIEGYKIVTQDERQSSFINIVQRNCSALEHQKNPLLLNVRGAYKAFMCNGFNTLLFKRLREDNGYVYGLEFNSSVTMYDSTNFLASEVNEDYLKGFFTSYEETMNEFNQVGISSKTFKKLIRSIKNNYPFEKNDSYSTVGSIITQDSIGLEPVSDKQFYKNFDLITKEDLMSFHAEYFTGRDYFICGISSPEKKKELIEAIKFSKLTLGNS